MPRLLARSCRAEVRSAGGTERAGSGRRPHRLGAGPPRPRPPLGYSRLPPNAEGRPSTLVARQVDELLAGVERSIPTPDAAGARKTVHPLDGPPVRPRPGAASDEAGAG